MLAHYVSLVGALTTAVAAHGYVESFKTDGVEHPGYLIKYYYDKKNGLRLPELAAWSAENLDSGFIAPENYTSPDIICAKNAGNANSTVQVSAGGTVEFRWNKWAHFGPVMTYVARCPADDCTTADKTALEFVKIDEAGIDVGSQEWAATAMVKNNLTWVTKVPNTLAAGHYVFRHETIAVQGSYYEGGAQNYPQCFNIEITGTGTAQPAGVRAQELYTPTDPGILFNPYVKNITSYSPPGPALFKDATPNSNSSISAATSASNTSASAAPTGSSFSNATTSVVQVPAAHTTLATAVRPASHVSKKPEESKTSNPEFSTAFQIPSETSAAVTESPKPAHASKSTGHAVAVPSSGAISALAPAETTTTKSTDSEGEEAKNSDGDILPETFTLETFIAWLLRNASDKSRRHARQLGA
ncbi:Endoglucanase-7 [Colletotrichum orbiculare MAFF 240422]|uniref:lytic cellulose monooxygenase (C4-dehydrogenating) n=1 Tax=Colletotrichum orbiculare (strain 104-T / ATCC 96160 / CBS 514.97 / LARS 414 / MAFF 240422) TaxID=1213857 RepID=N4VD90_COLOR|nr:Endoglucanase-7 [Colletotrichum orbiculare MAFF 240422]